MTESNDIFPVKQYHPKTVARAIVLLYSKIDKFRIKHKNYTAKFAVSVKDDAWHGRLRREAEKGTLKKHEADMLAFYDSAASRFVSLVPGFLEAVETSGGKLTKDAVQEWRWLYLKNKPGELNKAWVDKFLVPLGASISLVILANQFDDPQSAWRHWRDPGELLWILFKVGADRGKILACLADIVEHITFDAYAELKRRKDVRRAIDAIRRCSEDYSEHNIKEAEEIADILERAAISERVSYPSTYVLRAVGFAAVAASNSDRALVVAPYVTCCAARASEDEEEEVRWQLSCIRRYFSKSPFLKESK